MPKLNNNTREKQEYRIKNWSSYNNNLKKRGDITLWIDEEVVLNWYAKGEKKRGAQYKYSDESIACLLCIKSVFKLAYRQLQGFTKSIIKLMQFDIKAPSYTQICRRAKELEIDIEAPKSNKGIFIVLDSTGLKVFGEGEWKARKHGIGKRRTWRKLHLRVDEQTGFIHAQVLTENGTGDGDAQQTKEIIDSVKSPIEKFSGDGAYDTYEIWKMLKDLKIEGIIPPQENAIYWVDEFGKLLDLGRNEILKKIDKIGRKKWKKISNYHRSSLSETAMMRFKIIFGPTLYSRIFEKQKIEAAIKVKCLNKMTAIDMPISEEIKKKKAA